MMADSLDGWVKKMMVTDWVGRSPRRETIEESAVR